MREYLQGWFAIYELKDKCNNCSEVVIQGRMACCPYNQPSFPAAHNCPRFKYDQENDDN